VLHAHLSTELQALYTVTDGRRLVADSAAGHEAAWAEEAELATSSQDAHDLVRDASCHKVVLWWAHHVPEATRRELRADLTLPLLPTAIPEKLAWDGSQDPNVTRALQVHVGAVSCIGCHLNPATIDYEEVSLSQDPKPMLWPLQFEMVTNITGHTFGASLVQKTEYRYQHMQARYVTTDSAEEVSQNCTVLFEKTAIWEWYDDGNGVIRCAKLFDGIGVAPRNWFVADNMSFVGYRNYTNPLGEAAFCPTWCAGEFCYAEDNKTSLPWVHPHKTGFSWFEHVLEVKDELRGPFKRPASCPPSDALPKFTGAFDGSDSSITATVACQRAWLVDSNFV